MAIILSSSSEMAWVGYPESFIALLRSVFPSSEVQPSDNDDFVCFILFHGETGLEDCYVSKRPMACHFHGEYNACISACIKLRNVIPAESGIVIIDTGIGGDYIELPKNAILEEVIKAEYWP
jgi:hypothetical protein